MRKLVWYGIVAAFLAAPWHTPELRAQGSRKDDVIINAQGRPLAGATVRVCTANSTGQPCTPLANIYSNQTLTQALANPLTTDGLGNYFFYAAPCRYTIEVSGPGLITKQFQNVILPNDPVAPITTKSSAYTLTAADTWVNVTGTTTITVPHAIVGSRWVVFNSGSNTVTVQADSGNINGAASITLSANTGREITCDGSNCFAH
jgi:hypothetical protein